LPERLPPVLPELWRQPLPSDGIGGLAVAEGVVIVGGRDAADGQDLFLAFDAESGAPRWEIAYPAAGELDYGNSPRATPLVHDGLVYLQGAFGHLTCADVATGAILWQRNIGSEFGTPPLDWGLAGSPLLDGERLFVQPGGVRGSIAALDPLSGETLWATGSTPPGHASLLVAPRGAGRQLIGYDKLSLGGWDPATGERLWTFTPPVTGDFNVPMPLLLGNQLLLTTENNGARLYPLNAKGAPATAPSAQYEALSPDAHSPVTTAGRVFGVHAGLHALNPEVGLAPSWTHDAPEYNEYAALVASETRVLCLTLKSELILFDARADNYRELGRCPLSPDETETLAHPALAGSRIFVRIGRELICLDLEAEEP
jgi:outer membrane protein assembly factor BamB